MAAPFAEPSAVGRCMHPPPLQRRVNRQWDARCPSRLPRCICKTCYPQAHRRARSGVRTHAEIPPVDLKSIALTTRPSWHRIRSHQQPFSVPLFSPHSQGGEVGRWGGGGGGGLRQVGLICTTKFTISIDN